RRDPRHLPPGNLAENDRAVGHPYRPFRKAEIARRDLDIGHLPLRLRSVGFTLSALQEGEGRAHAAGGGGGGGFNSKRSGSLHPTRPSPARPSNPTAAEC